MNERVTRYGTIAVVGLAAVALIIGWMFYSTSSNHLTLTGKITDARTLALDEKSTLLVVDFQVTNPTDVRFVTATAEVVLTGKDGSKPEAFPVSEVDAKRLFDYYKQLGPKKNASLLTKDKILPHQTLDRMLAVRFDLPEAEVKERKGLELRLVDLDGTEVTLR